MKNKLDKNFIMAIGRRKSATAVVSLTPIDNVNVKKILEINGKYGENYLQGNYNYLSKILSPLKKTKLLKQYKIIINVQGGGVIGQTDAIKLGIARAICKIDKEKFRPTLKSSGLLSRDSRIKERRKYGLKKARKASQFSKR